MIRILEKYIAAARNSACITLLNAANRFTEPSERQLKALYQRWAKEALTEAPTVALLQDAYFMQTGDYPPKFYDWS